MNTNYLTFIDLEKITHAKVLLNFTVTDKIKYYNSFVDRLFGRSGYYFKFCEYDPEYHKLYIIWDHKAYIKPHIELYMGKELIETLIFESEYEAQQALNKIQSKTKLGTIIKQNIQK